jgi:hypothetical protein
MKPDESLFKAHLEEAPFQSGADAGKWGMHGEAKDIIWPHPILWVRADKAIVPVGKIFLRFTVDGYSTDAPTACPWNVEKNSRLENALWPRLTGKFARVFRLDWKGGIALYAPCDRMAMPGHETWQQQFPFWWWQPQFTIVKYLEFVHMCLNPLRYEAE